MKKENVQFIDDLPEYVTRGPIKMQLESYLVALEGWRRGLKLKFYSRKVRPTGLKILDKTTEGRIFSLEYDQKKHYFYRSRGDLVSEQAVSVCQNKEATKKYLTKSNVPVPLGFEFKIGENINLILSKAKEKVGYPLVLKPLSGSMGKGVIINIQDETELINHLEEIRNKQGKYKNFMIEMYIPGEEYRMYVVGDKLIGAINRIPANIVGDGKQTIQELIDEKNKIRNKIPYLSYKPIKVDKSVQTLLSSQGYDLNSVIADGQQVFLRKVSNLSTGGDPLDETDNLTNEVKKIAENALNAIPNLAQGGVDVIVDPNNPKKGYVIEINATAEIAFHHFPIKGKARYVSKAIIDYYFPETIDKGKTDLFFNYQDVLKPLDSLTSDEVAVTQVDPKITETYKYTITGKLGKAGYLTTVKRIAAKNNIHGYVKKINDQEVEARIASFSSKDLSVFEKALNKGTKKSKVEDVKREQLDEFLKVGFEIKK